MPEHSPSTAVVPPPADPELPAGAPAAEKFERSRSQRIGIGGMAALVWVVFIIGAAIVIPMVVHNPTDPGLLAGRGLFKVSGHPLGGDSAGNDMLLQLAKGARSSLIVALGAVLFGLTVGGTLGLISGYYRGRVDTVLTSVFNILLAIPQFVLAVALVSVLANDSISRSGIPTPVSSSRRLLVLVVALGIVSAPILARITRANTLQWAQRDFVLAARAQGARNRRIMVREVLPNVLPAMFSIALLGIAVAMVAEGGLSILGVGVHLPGVSWGSLIAAGRNSLQDQPSVVFEPIVCLFLTVLSLNYLGDVVRARFDVREKCVVSLRRRKKTEDRFADAPLDGPLLEVNDVRTFFKTERGLVRAVDGVSLSLERGKTIGVVGESGSGKSVLSRSIMGLLPANVERQGSIKFEGREIGSADTETMRKYWGTQMSMVFQDPMTSLNPVMRIGNQITESLRYHLDVSKDYADETALALLTSVGIPEAERRMREYPHQMSGGMRQRVMIAIVLACGPKLLFADEPTTALDVTVQAQILELLQAQQRERFMAMVLVTHDLGVVAGRADHTAVMYAGQIVEHAATRDLFTRTSHPYTEALLKSIPKLSQPSHTRLEAISGRPPDLVNPPAGCKFAARCPYAQPKCLEVEPPLDDAAEVGHAFRCFFPVGTEAGKQALERNLAAGVTASGLAVGRTGAAIATGTAVVA